MDSLKLDVLKLDALKWDVLNLDALSKGAKGKADKGGTDWITCAIGPRSGSLPSDSLSNSCLIRSDSNSNVAF